MTIRDKIMRSLVKKEATKLEKLATQEELKRLSFNRLNPDHVNLCIYGQITGDCFSLRSNELISKCAQRVYKTVLDRNIQDLPLNGKPTRPRDFSGVTLYYSPIETFILQDKESQPENNARLIAYLKGETKTLKFI